MALYRQATTNNVYQVLHHYMASQGNNELSDLLKYINLLLTEKHISMGMDNIFNYYGAMLGLWTKTTQSYWSN